MLIANLLWTPEAKAIYKSLKSKWSKPETEQYCYIIARYCNELAFYHKVEKQLAASDEILQEHTNNKCKTNEKKSELTRTRNESMLLLNRLETALNLTPKQNKGDGDNISIELPE